MSLLDEIKAPSSAQRVLFKQRYAQQAEASQQQAAGPQQAGTAGGATGGSDDVVDGEFTEA